MCMFKKALAFVTSFLLIISLFSIPPREAQATATTIFLTDTGLTSWTVPSDWNNSDNTIEVIGGGGGGGRSGGGAYSKVSNQTLSGTVGIQVGAGGGPGADGEDTWLCNSTSNCATIGGSAVIVGAKGGSTSGGSAASGVGTVKYSGGNPGVDTGTSQYGEPGGGGAAGPLGNGGNGGNVDGDGYSGGGGGGNGGGSNGQDDAGFRGGDGGDNFGGTGGGTGAEFTTGTAGTDGGGGAGGGYTGGEPSVGGNGTEWDATHGSGGGAGGGGTGACFDDANGGLYGGGASVEDCAPTASGGQGIIVITYTPSSGRSVLSKPANNLGLVAYWSLNEGSGTNVSDASGNSYNGTLNSANWVTGKFGKAFNSTGSTNVALPNSLISTISNTNEITISAWFKGTNAQSAVRLQPAGTDFIVFPWNDSGTRKAIISTDGSVSSGVTVPGAEDNRWHHMVMTWKRNTVNGFKVYVDGVVANQRDSADASLPNFSTFNFVSYLGTYGGGAGEDMVGTLDDVRIYSRELTSSQVTALYRQGSAIVGGAEKTAVKNGLVAHWTLNGNDVVWSSASAGTVYDRVGGSNGTLTNMNQSTAPVQGKIGQALSFNGTNQYIDLGTPSALDVTGNITLSAWINLSSLSQSEGFLGYVVGNGYQSAANEGYVLRYQVTGGLKQIFVGSYIFSGNQDNSTSWTLDYSVNTWHHIVGLYDGTHWVLYSDGVQVSSTADAQGAQSTTAKAGIGAGEINGVFERFFPGKIDDVRIYNRALSDSEIKQLYRMGSGAVIRSN